MDQVSGSVTRDVNVRTKKGKNCPCERERQYGARRERGMGKDKTYLLVIGIVRAHLEDPDILRCV